MMLGGFLFCADIEIMQTISWISDNDIGFNM